MSEFSESLHLHSATHLDAVALLERGSARGFVFPPRNGWVAFVCGASPADVAAASAARPDLPPGVAEWMALRAAAGAATERILRANTSTLLHYAFAADHGCTVDLFEGPHSAGRIEVGFEDGASRFDEAAFVRCAILSHPACAELRAWLATAASFHDRQLRLLQAQLAVTDEESESVSEQLYLADRYFVARILGLVDYTWLSFESQLEMSDVPDRIAVP